MSFNPLEEKGRSIDDQIRSWSQLNVEPYNKNDIHPYTKTRIILMNGIEVEAAIFLHQMARHYADPEINKTLAMGRRIEQQQQKMINWLSPGDETILETTIGYEQVAVDLTAWLARKEPDPVVKQALDFALLEDFDHLYRYANLLDLEGGVEAETLVGGYTEIFPGRPTINEHRHPYDGIRPHIDKDTADFLTKMHVLTIIAGEQQTMNFYMNIGNTQASALARGLYLEIAQIEEQHVTHYESLNDPNQSWWEMLLMHEYHECYMYYSCLQDETDSRLKSMWESHLEDEIAHLHLAVEMFKNHDKRDPQEVLPDSMPDLIKFEENKDYVRKVLEEQVDWTANEEDYIDMNELSESHRYFQFQNKVNDNGSAPSQDVISRRIKEKKKDYRFESEGENPVQRFREREAVVR